MLLFIVRLRSIYRNIHCSRMLLFIIGMLLFIIANALSENSKLNTGSHFKGRFPWSSGEGGGVKFSDKVGVSWFTQRMFVFRKTEIAIDFNCFYLPI